MEAVEILKAEAALGLGGQKGNELPFYNLTDMAYRANSGKWFIPFLLQGLRGIPCLQEFFPFDSSNC